MSIIVKRVVARRKALERALAIEIARMWMPSWGNLSDAARQSMIEQARRRMDQWVRDGVVIEFEDELREGEL